MVESGARKRARAFSWTLRFWPPGLWPLGWSVRPRTAAWVGCQWLRKMWSDCPRARQTFSHNVIRGIEPLFTLCFRSVIQVVIQKENEEKKWW